MSSVKWLDEAAKSSAVCNDHDTYSTFGAIDQENANTSLEAGIDVMKSLQSQSSWASRGP